MQGQGGFGGYRGEGVTACLHKSEGAWVFPDNQGEKTKFWAPAGGILNDKGNYNQPSVAEGNTSSSAGH